MRQYREITENDVGEPLFDAFGKMWVVGNFMGRILSIDIGKRVYLVGDILQVENDMQRSKRMREVKP